ncbi:uncharacterized protein LOC127130640 [Lathyrus oleraceus]|uniref:uncharacterized protein LOC127130640 n=1 Tax=Pisum sativum TaxID=3888 RepID=UPI0021CF9CCE|nr:uncharacterized protein LOC127130640 [Pisum sativum]
MENQEANDLVQIAYGYKISKSRFQEIIELQEKMVSNVPSSPNMDIQKTRGEDNPDDSVNCDEGFDDKGLDNSEFENFVRHEVFTIGNLSPSDWRKPIIEYLENPVRNTDRKIKYRALSYIHLGKKLLKKIPEGILLKCLGNKEAYLTISEVHSGACGAHQVGHKMKWLLF